MFRNQYRTTEVPKLTSSAWLRSKGTGASLRSQNVQLRWLAAATAIFSTQVFDPRLSNLLTDSTVRDLVVLGAELAGLAAPTASLAVLAVGATGEQSHRTLSAVRSHRFKYSASSVRAGLILEPQLLDAAGNDMTPRSLLNPSQ